MYSKPESTTSQTKHLAVDGHFTVLIHANSVVIAQTMIFKEKHSIYVIRISTIGSSNLYNPLEIMVVHTYILTDATNYGSYAADLAKFDSTRIRYH